MAAGGHFGWPKITFIRISRHFRSMCNFNFVLHFVLKMVAGGHCGWPKITFDRFFSQNGCRGHFGWPKITFDCISRHFRSIRNFYFFTKWLPAAILDDRKSLSIAFLDILDQYKQLLFCSQNGYWRPFWMTENHFRSHFSPFQINTQLYFLIFVHKMAAGGHFGWTKITFVGISRYFRSIRNF